MRMRYYLVVCWISLWRLMHFELLGRSLIVVGWSFGWLAGLSFIVVRPDQ